MSKLSFLMFLKITFKKLWLIWLICFVAFDVCPQENPASKSPKSGKDLVLLTSTKTNDQILTKIINDLTPFSSYKITISFSDSDAPTSQLIKVSDKKVAEINYDKPLVKRSIYFYAIADEVGQIKINFEKLCVGAKRFYTNIEVVKENKPTVKIKTNVIILGDSITEGYPFFDVSL